MLKYAKNARPASDDALQRDALLRVCRQQPVLVVEHARHEIARHVDQVELAAVEREQPRIRFLDHRHSRRGRPAAAACPSSRRTPRGLPHRRSPATREKSPRDSSGWPRARCAGARRHSLSLNAPVPTGLAIAQPLASPYASITSRATAADLRRRQRRQERVVGLDELELQRVAIERAQALDLGVVVELAAGLRHAPRRDPRACRAG